MRYLSKFLVLLFILGVAVAGCDDEYDSLVDANLERRPIPDTEVEASQGDADFTNYVAIGNSLTAGFMDAALYTNGQRFSLGALLSAQFEATGAPSTFNQPDINSVNGFNTLVNTGNGPVLGRFKLDTSIPGPSPTLNGDPIEPYTGETSSLNNFGVPGIQLGQLLTPDTGNPSSPAFNPFYARFASAPGSSTILEDAISAAPTFFTLWIGINDLLGYATGGATNPSVLTDQNDFEIRFQAVINTLMQQTEAKGVVANIPPILGVPYFRAVGYNVIEFDESDQATVDQLNAAFSGFNQVLDGIVQFPGHSQADANRRKVQYSLGANPVLIFDPNLENIEQKMRQLAAVNPQLSNDDVDMLLPFMQARPIREGELVLFPAASVLGTLADPDNPTSVIGVAVPLENRYTLTFEQLAEIEGERQAYNQAISSTIETNEISQRLALYDTNDPTGAFADIFGMDGSSPGISIDGTFLNPDFSPNGVFSTDGVHPNARGNAILANEFLRVIEAEFNATIPKVDVLALPSVSVCAGDCLSQQGGS
jgi:lysophospholipase L1-like esterase